MLVGAVDLFYLHLWKYKLHTRPESRYEHKLHMAFAFFLVPVAFLLYFRDFGGYALWAGAFFVVAALATEMLDVFAEGDSRAPLGGLTTAEYSLHVGATILKVASFAFIFASKLGSYGYVGEMIAIKVMAGGLLIGLLHLALLDRRIGSIELGSAWTRLCCRLFPC